MENKKERKVTLKKVLLAICIIGLITGIILWGSATTTETYDIDEFRISRNARYTDKTEDLLGDNEKCKIQGKEITVTTRNDDLYTAGMIVTIFFGFIDGIWIWNYFEDRRFNEE